jgi:hypothetical protein
MVRALAASAAGTYFHNPELRQGIVKSSRAALPQFLLRQENLFRIMRT